MYGCELDHKEGWAPKNWCFWTLVLETTLESPLDSNKVKLVNPKGNHHYGRKWRASWWGWKKSENSDLKLSIQKTKITASGLITSWQVDGETVETVIDFIFWGSKMTAGGDCSHETKRCLFLGRKALTNRDSISKSIDITLPTKVRLVKAMVFLVVMYGYESWTIKKAEHRRIDAFELWCWRRLLRVPWTARRSN